MMADPTHAHLIERWFRDLFTVGEIDLVDELVAPTFVSRDPNGKLGANSPEAFKGWLRWYLSSFTDADWTIHEILSVGEKAVVRYSGYTTYQGGLLDLPATNQRVLEMGVLIFRIVDGRVHELWSALCDLELVFALGAKIVPPGEA
jgi:predicted ester cyclase